MSSGNPTARKRLDRAAVVDAAIAVADATGLEDLSMRRLADALGVTPMALYKHVDGREALLDEMVERLVAAIPAAPEGHWKSALRTRFLAARRVILRHPWAQSAIETRAVAGPEVLTYMDSLMDIMFRGGLSADLVHHAMHALSTRMWGFTRDILPTPTIPDDPGQRAAAMAAYAQQYPAIIRMATTATNAGVACDSDAEFAFALDILLDSFERLHAEGWTPAAIGAVGRES